MWKLPGGLMDLGEEISDAVVREVLEETGVKARFKSILNFRHQHGAAFGRDDIYIVCLMEPEGDESIRHDEKEIAACAWLPMDEYVASAIDNARQRDLPETMNSFFMRSIQSFVHNGVPQGEAEWGFHETQLNAKVSQQAVTGLTNRHYYKMYHPPQYLSPRETKQEP